MDKGLLSSSLIWNQLKIFIFVFLHVKKEPISPNISNNFNPGIPASIFC